MFPELLFLSPVAATLIRVALAIVFVYAGWQHLSKGAAHERAFGVLGIVIAVALFIGAWTQLAALAATAALAASLFMPNIRIFPRSTVMLALVMALSLLVTGPGAFAFDLPL